MDADAIADLIEDTTGDRPAVHHARDRRRPELDSMERRIAAAPAVATAQKMVGLLTVLGNHLDTLAGRLPGRFADEVDTAREDLSAANLAVGRLRKTLENLALARGAS